MAILTEEREMVDTGIGLIARCNIGGGVETGLEALSGAYIMLSRPLENEICFACPSQLPVEEKAPYISSGLPSRANGKRSSAKALCVT
ncbi:hypothetical protein QLX08_003825 [Tetragonisca angustula]|uniref:Uncharacterized protein n=1 Tax=Tetragonisca angustula TaxID=166442 RepID=A0AAW1A8L4_9HYME